MISEFPCGTCSKRVTNNHYAVYCDICKIWVLIKCNNITKYCYRKLEKSEDQWYCKNCVRDIEFSQNQLEKVFIDKLVTSPKNVLKANPINFTNKKLRIITHNDLVTPEDFDNLDILPTFYFCLRMNMSSLLHHFDDFETLIEKCPVKPRMIGIYECCLRTNKEPLSHINLKDYTYEFTPTDSTKRGHFNLY